MVDQDHPTLLLVHGAWHGSWAWDPLLPKLAEAGVRARTVDLPGVGRAPGRHDLTGHVAWLRGELARSTGPVVICSHSYGGAVVSDAADGMPTVAGLVYLAAFMIEAGQSCADANKPAPTPPDPTLTSVRDGDYLRVPEPAARHMFYGDATEAQAVAAARRLTPEHVGTVTAPITRAAWRSVPSTYVVTERDAAILPEVQHRLARNASRTLTIDSGHSPMLTRPDELTALLVGTVRGGHDAR